jgi:predicted nucleotidyltransferase
MYDSAARADIQLACGGTVYPHHAETIQRAVERFRNDPEVLALLLGGSVAHGFARQDSDIDVMVIVSDERFAERSRAGQLLSVFDEIATYPKGYVDAKYLGAGVLPLVAEKGSEPARFAFKDALVLFSRLDGIDETLKLIARFPVEGKAERMRRFMAQLEAWNWYAAEALKHGNPYLLSVSVDKVVLFGGRLILADNELLYPYHKWFLRVLADAPDQPPDLTNSIRTLLDDHSAENIQRFYELVKGFRDWGASDIEWPAQFVADSELNWVDRPAPVDDL